jgi:hypothetical protein
MISYNFIHFWQAKIGFISLFSNFTSAIMWDIAACILDNEGFLLLPCNAYAGSGYGYG